MRPWPPRYNNDSLLFFRIGLCIADNCSSWQMEDFLDGLVDVVRGGLEQFVYIDGATVYCPSDAEPGEGKFTPAYYVTVGMLVALTVTCVIGTVLKWPKAEDPARKAARDAAVSGGNLAAPLMDVTNSVRCDDSRGGGGSCGGGGRGAAAATAAAAAAGGTVRALVVTLGVVMLPASASCFRFHLCCCCCCTLLAPLPSRPAPISFRPHVPFRCPCACACLLPACTCRADPAFVPTRRSGALWGQLGRGRRQGRSST